MINCLILHTTYGKTVGGLTTVVTANKAVIVFQEAEPGGIQIVL